jgi:hypothetical protein
MTMKTTVDTDLELVPSEEAKICMTCPKKKCTPVTCNRLKTLKRKECKKK